MNNRGLLKERAKKLRSQGKTYSQIKKNLKQKIPKSTLSSWCKNISLPSWYHRTIQQLNSRNLTKAQKMAWFINREKRKLFLKKLWNKNVHLTRYLKRKGILKIILAFLYLGEGAKWVSHSGMQLGSSDKNIIKLYLRLLKRCYKINPNRLKCRISYRADQNIRSLEKYWSKITKIPLLNFYKTIPDPRTIGKPTKSRDYKGVCVISGSRSDIQLELEMIPKIILKGI